MSFAFGVSSPAYDTGVNVQYNGAGIGNRMAIQSGNEARHPEWNIKPQSKVLVIYTGGTIGMVKNEKGSLIPSSQQFIQNLKTMSQTHDSEYMQTLATPQEKQYALPETKEPRRVLYTILEYEPLLDSSNMNTDDWRKIADDVRRYYKDYDGFVILHGTDTLSYTASALSFMLQNLGKTVVITGSQVPIFEIRGDGLDNFVAAVVIAGNFTIPEVSVYFDGRLFRGNRVIKRSADAYDAFDSPNYPPLAKIGINIELEVKNIRKPTTLQEFTVFSELNSNVVLLRLFPSISNETVKSFLQHPTQGVVLQTYGAGNMPSNRPELFDLLQKATEKGIIIVNCSQCISGTVSGEYETSQVVRDAGVLCGYDMTPEAALTKLAFVLARQDWDLKTKKEKMIEDLCGELSKPLEGPETLAMMDSVSKMLTRRAESDVEFLPSVLCPAVIAEAILQGNSAQLQFLKEKGCDLSTPNADLRTPLHIACCEGNEEIVRFLLTHGSSVHAKDRFDRTPLDDAVAYDHHEIIKLLVKVGAHLREQTDRICASSARGNITRLMSYQLAGSALNQPDLTGKTPLHYAAMFNKIDCVKYLLSHPNMAPTAPDILGETPVTIARRLQHVLIEQMLSNYRAN